MQLDNGIPILPFYSDKNDTQLTQLAEFLKVLEPFEDVREHLRNVFCLQKYLDYETPAELVKNLFSSPAWTATDTTSAAAEQTDLQPL